ncbi:MAG: hypothetical protein R3B09_20845 [Nannocystaceae bacterium]
MDIAVFTPTQRPLALRALADVMRPGGPPSPRGQQYLDTLAELLGGPAELAPPSDLAAIAAAIPEARPRRRLVQLAAIAALVDGAPTRGSAAALAALDRALGVGEPAIAVIRHLARGHRRRARLLIARRIAYHIYGAALRAEGLGGLLKILRPLMLGRSPFYPDVAWRYRQLGTLPAGSFGHEFWQHCTERRFAFPGEGGAAIPERLVFHDVGHVLAGYGTDPAGEIQQGAFQAGFVRRDGFMFLIFAVVQFHLGIQVTPVARGEVGYFDVPRVLRALARGAACPVDLSADLRLWDDGPRPLVEVRGELGL